MSTLVNAMRTGDTFTENGMVTNSSSLSATLNLFFVIGAIRNQMKTEDGKNRLIGLFEAAHNEDALLTRKLLFWARDVREGAGEREAFRVLLRYASDRYPDEVISNLHLISEFGRWDDLFVTFGTPVEENAINLIIDGLESGNGLLAKWMPRTGGKVSAEKKFIANRVRSVMGLSPKEFRKLIVGLTNVVETKMCAKEFDNIEYSKVPSVAMARYTKAFGKNDNEGFTAYIESLKKGETKVNAGAVYPYDILKTMNRGNQSLANEQWKALPNFLMDSKERVLPVCDVSGSMSTAVSGETTAMDVCISLGLYISERNVGPFKDAFVTFSSRPQLQYLTGDLISRYRQLQRADWGMSTNLEATFKMVLDQAVKHKVPTIEMPTAILIMSDMEFNSAVDRNHRALDMIRSNYEQAGYEMPKVIFWNLCSRHNNFPVQAGENNTALISGFSPSILKSVLAGEVMNPVNIMLKALNVERYSMVQ
jgi:hypothetical protein